MEPQLQDLQGKSRISKRSFSERPVFMVWHKPESLNQTNNSLPWTFASKIIWTKGSTAWPNAAPSATKRNEEEMERLERRRGDSFVAVLLIFLFSSLGSGATRWRADMEGLEKKSGIRMHDMKFPKNQLKKNLFLKKKIQWLLVKYFCELLVALKLSTKSYLKNIGIFLFKWSYIRTEFLRGGSFHWGKREEEGVMNSQFFILSQESARSLDWTPWFGCALSPAGSCSPRSCMSSEQVVPTPWWLLMWLLLCSPAQAPSHLMVGFFLTSLWLHLFLPWVSWRTCDSQCFAEGLMSGVLS